MYISWHHLFTSRIAAQFIVVRHRAVADICVLYVINSSDFDRLLFEFVPLNIYLGILKQTTGYQWRSVRHLQRNYSS